MNGVFVFWNGNKLYTKSGNEIRLPDSFRNLIIPGFAFTAEMFFGYGNLERALASTFSQNKTPHIGTNKVRENAGQIFWKNCRIVAFDVPIFADGWTYKRRYNLLCRMVAVWTYQLNRRLKEKPTEKENTLPLQVIRAYNLQDIENFFREVVSHSRSDKKDVLFEPFGIPEKGKESDDYLLPKKWKSPPQVVSIFHKHKKQRPCGEGLMLYDLSSEWVSRKESGKMGTISIIKYKPIVLSVGTVVKDPTHTHHDLTEDNHESKTPGYQIKIRWFDQIRGSVVIMTAYIPPVWGPRKIIETFKPGT